MMTATQDQALPSRQKRKHIKKQIETSMSRLCGKKEEIKFHILSECSKIAATDYKKRHDGVANTVHWNQIKQYEFKTTQKWATRQNSVEKPKRKIFLDLNIQTDHVIQARSPDIAVKEKRIRPHVAD